jgi:hypothetical protein
MTSAQKQIIDFVEEEARRIGYGKIIIEVSVHNGKLTNVQAETKRSMNINEGQQSKDWSMGRREPVTG